MTSDHPRIWVLLGRRIGDNNQLLALAEGLKLPFETRTLGYNLLRRLSPRLLGATRLSLDSRSRCQLAPPWPDLVIGIGRRSVPVARWIRRQSGGRTRIVRLGNPRLGPRAFDLVVTTRQYPLPRAANVIVLPLAMTRLRSRPEADANEQEFLSALPRPHHLFALGGWTKFWRMKRRRIADAASRLRERAEIAGGTLIIATSPRTEARIVDALSTTAGHASCRLITDDWPRFRVLLDDADEIFVTADSVSMISEALVTGKPVGMVPVDPDPRTGPLAGMRYAAGGRDLRRFWAELSHDGLVGTIDRPVRAQVEDPVLTAAAAVRRLLG